MKHGYYCLLALLALHTQLVFAQNTPPCASDYFLEMTEQNPAQQARREALEAEFFHFFQQRESGVSAQKGGIRIVPVVVHIIHDGGPENLSDAQVEQGIAWLNEALANSGAFAQGSGADTEIRLCLAQRTPDNQSTNGITHTQSPLTQLNYNTQDLALKNTIRWNPKDYLNIWVVREICHSNGDCGPGGYVVSWIDHGGPQDGIVVEARNWGADPGFTPVVAHEVGHYFSLYHTFQGACVNVNCLTQGDRICDTPPDQSTAAVPCGQTVNSCNTDTQSGPFTSDQPDMSWNFMDYGAFACMHDFTPDQAARMNQHLSSERKALLQSKGCKPPCINPAVVSILASATAVTAGTTVFFLGDSNSALLQWTVNGQLFGNLLEASYLFAMPGLYTVTLTAAPIDATSCEEEKAEIVINVTCPVKASFSVSSNYLEPNEWLSLTDNSIGVGTKEWFVNGVSYGASLSSFFFSTAGEYEIKLVMTSGTCQSVATELVYVQGACDYKTGQWHTAFVEPHSVMLSDSGLLLLLKASATDFRLVKLTKDGNLVWAKKTATDMGALLLATPDGGFVSVKTGSSTVFKFSAQGNFEWSRHLGSVDGACTIVAATIGADGHLAVCGGIAEEWMFWARIAPDGAVVWSNKYLVEAPINMVLSGIAEHPDGGYLATARRASQLLLLRIGTNGGVLWKKSFAGNLPVIPGLYPGRSFDLAYSPTENAFMYFDASTHLLKFDTTGVKLWHKEITISLGPFTTGFRNMRLLKNGEMVMYGNDSGHVIKVDANADLIWVRKYRQNLTADIIDLHPHPEGGFWGTGRVGASQLTWILRIDRNGFAGGCEIEDGYLRFEEKGLGSYFHDLLPAGTLTVMPDLEVVTTNAAFTRDSLCPTACPRITEDCNNNLDDDGDGLFDCLDNECDCTLAPCTRNKRGNVWYFGSYYGLDFNTEPPTLLTDPLYSTILPSSTISDENGQLLLTTGGFEVYNRLQLPIPKPIPLLGHGGILLPHPGNKGLIYLFDAYVDPVTAYGIDMAKDAGYGAFDPQQQIHLLGSSPVPAQRLSVVGTCDGGFWIAALSAGGVFFHTWRLDQNGVNPNPVESFVGLGGIGNFKFSPDGRFIAMTVLKPQAGVWIFDFNTLLGGVTNPRFFPVDAPNMDGLPAPQLEFSPNGRFLYTGFTAGLFYPYGLKLFQFDLDAEGFPHTLIPNNIEYTAGDMQLAPNGKIYISNLTFSQILIPHLNAILQPNEPGEACLFKEKAFSFFPSGGTANPLCQNISSDFYQPRLHFAPESPDTICGYENTSFDYRVIAPPCFAGDINWALEGIQGNLSANGETAQIEFSEAGYGRIIVSAQTPCGLLTDTLPVLVSAPLETVLELGPDLEVCDNGVFTFSAGAGFARYLWSTGSPDSVLTTYFPGKYWVDVWDLCGAKQTDTVTVSIAPGSVLDLGALPPAVCKDFTRTFSRPPQFAQWSWAPADFLSCADCPSVTVSPSADVSWVVTAQTAEGCISVDTLHADVRDTIFVTLDTFVCVDRTLAVFGTMLPPDTSALLLLPASAVGCDTVLRINVLGVENVASQRSVTICANAFFEFNGTILPPDTVAVFKLQSSFSCDSLVTVTVKAYPPLLLSLPMDTSIQIGAAVLLQAEASGSGTLEYAWQPMEGLSCTACPDPLATPLDTITYTLIVTDANGCTVQQQVTLRVSDECALHVPTAFSPNGDGANDVFRPISDPCVRNIRVWRIVNRWGETVFEQYNIDPKNTALGWDGQFTNGKSHPSDVLFWQLEVEYYDGRRESRHGEVSLLR